MAMRKVVNSDNNDSLIHKELLISFIDKVIKKQTNKFFVLIIKFFIFFSQFYFMKN